jgi:hypothetical protein
MNRSHRSSPGGLVKLPSSSSDFSVFSTNGDQLTGDLTGYNELAHEFDRKRIVLYCEVSAAAIVLGTRLMVQIIGGREERAIYFGKYAIAEPFFKGDFINRFYDDARARVEHLDQIKYRVLGLINEGDLPIRERSTSLSFIPAITGKLLIREPVRIKTGDLSLSLGVVRTIIKTLKEKNIQNYKIAIAQYPVDIDILISPHVPDPDLEIPDSGPEKVQPVFKKKEPVFRAVSEIYDRQRTTLFKIGSQDPETVSRTLKNALLSSDLFNGILRAHPEDTRDILDLYRGDPGLLYVILKKIYTVSKTLDGVPQEIIALAVSHIIASGTDPGSDEAGRVLLKTGYTTSENEDLKFRISQYLISNGIFEDYLIRDLFEKSLKTADAQLLQSVVGNPEFTPDNFQILKKCISSYPFGQDPVLAFIEALFASSFEKEPKSKGHRIYREIIRRYQDLGFNTRKLNLVQERYGRPREPLPRPAGSDKKILIIAVIAIIALIGLAFVYFGLFPFTPGSEQTFNGSNGTNGTPDASVNPGMPAQPANSSAVMGNQTGLTEVNRSPTMGTVTLVIQPGEAPVAPANGSVTGQNTFS